MSHTPGPWTVLYGGHGTDGYFVIASRGGDTLICDSSPRQLLPEAELNANARLIAAGPTMCAYVEKRAATGDADAIEILEAINATS